MAKKPGYTLEQHEQLGKELYAMSERLSDLRCELSSAYPQRVYKHAIKVHEALGELRNVLDNCVHEENQTRGIIRSYYRGNLPEAER